MTPPLMGCCTHCQATDEQFGPARARRDLRRYHKKGPDKTTQMLLSALRAQGLADATLLDVGAGIGVLHHELLGREVAAATHVEAASASLAEARAEAARRGNGERVTFVHGDFVDVASQMAEADVVTLDRVICCYPDYRGLLEAAGRKARRLCALSFPRDRATGRFIVAFINLVQRLRGSAFRVFVHPSADVEAAMRDLGFQLCSREMTMGWQALLYERRTT